ncbi:MAG: helix-turn-helix domain-containing protein [Nitrospinota bacterium]|nr:helix-turn-helix domain-containing protein [Nitrospinota bacterium]
MENLIKIAKAAKVNVQWLATGEGMRAYVSGDPEASQAMEHYTRFWAPEPWKKEAAQELPLEKRLAESRAKLEMTQTQVAEALDIGMSTYQNYEMGKNAPPFKVLRFFIERGIDPFWLILGKEAPHAGSFKAKIDAGMLVLAMQAVEEINSEHGLKLDLNRRARLATYLYEEESGATPASKGLYKRKALKIAKITAGDEK